VGQNWPALLGQNSIALPKLDLSKRQVPPVYLGDFKAAIKTAEAALSAGEELIENFKRYKNAEIKRRAAAEGGPS
jgi:hypothetical protein